MFSEVSFIMYTNDLPPRINTLSEPLILAFVFCNILYFYDLLHILLSPQLNFRSTYSVCMHAYVCM